MAREMQVELTATLNKLDDGRIELAAPSVGFWRRGPATGSLVRPGTALGTVEVLGVLHPMVAPEGAAGVVVWAHEPDRARRPVSFGELLLVLDPEAAGAVAAQDLAAAESSDAHAGEVFRSPMSGRFYLRPSPDKPAFVEVGDVLERGRTICLLEVMKTFNRVTFGGPGLPERARVTRIVPADGADVDENAVLLEIEKA